jgi:hypothetical protein
VRNVGAARRCRTSTLATPISEKNVRLLTAIGAKPIIALLRELGATYSIQTAVESTTATYAQRLDRVVRAIIPERLLRPPRR